MITYLFSRRFEQYFFNQPVLHFFLPLAATSAITYLSFNLGPIFFLKTYIIHIQARRNIMGQLGFVPTILANRGRGGALGVNMGFYADISWESRCNIEINVWGHCYQFLLVFQVPYPPLVKRMPEKAKSTKSW